MARIHSKPLVTKFAVAGAFSAMLLGGTVLSSPGFAGDSKLLITIAEDDGSLTELYQDQEDGHFWCIFRYQNGSVIIYDPSNPNPNDDTTGPGSHSDKPDVAALIKSGAATFTPRIAPADSAELLGHLKGGGGLGPRYNPSDDDNGNGPGAAPTHSMEVKKTAAEIRQAIEVANEVASALATLGGSMGDGEEGGTESPTGPNKQGGGNHGDGDGNYTEGQDKDIGQTEKDLLGPKPQYVNPPHLDRTATGGIGDHASTATGGTGGGGTGGGGSGASGGTGGAAGTSKGGGLGAHNALGGAHNALGAHG